MQANPTLSPASPAPATHTPLVGCANPSNPFASPASRSAASGIYRDVSVDQWVRQADPHQLVALLFEGLCEALIQARGALGHNDMAGKGKAIGRAVRIVEEGLRTGLDMRTGRLARDLDDLYSYISLRLTQANLRNDDAALKECLRLVKPIQEAWAAIAPTPQPH